MEIASRDFDLKRKHIFILSSAGKPIFTRHGDEQEIVTTFGLIQAVISIANDLGDTIKCIRSKNRSYVYFLRHSLYFVMITSTGESEAVLSLQLEFMYLLILVILTSHVHDILEKNSSKDIRDLLGPESTRLLQSSCFNEITLPNIAFQYVKTFSIPNEFRLDLSNHLKQCVEQSGAALGMLLHEDQLVGYCPGSLSLDTQDVMLLSHFVCNAHSLRSHDQNWVPICVPNFNSKAYLQAYIARITVKDTSNKQVYLFLVLVAASADPSVFAELHKSRQVFEENINRPSISNRIIYSFEQQDSTVLKYVPQSACLHFLYKYSPSQKDGTKGPSQGISSDFDVSLQSDDSQERIWITYQSLALVMRTGTAGPEITMPSMSPNHFKSSTIDATEPNIMLDIPHPDHALNYVVMNTGPVVVSLATADSELYVTFPGTISPLDACGLAKYLSNCLKTDAANIFLT